jgi:hypothetical protein
VGAAGGRRRGGPTGRANEVDDSATVQVVECNCQHTSVASSRSATGAAHQLSLTAPFFFFQLSMRADASTVLLGRAQKVGGLPWALEPAWAETKHGRQRWVAPPLNARAVAYLRKDVLLSGRCAPT